MNKTTTTLDRVETTLGHGTTRGSAEITPAPTPIVIAAITDLRAGSALMKSDTRLPKSVYFESEQYGSWKVLRGMDGFKVERALFEAGWHFFFMVPEISLGAVSLNPNKALRTALKKLFAAVEAKNFNALEIVEITAKRFLGLNYVTVVAHPRHIKKSPFLRDLNTYYVARNLWNAKGIWRRRSQIGSMRKGI
jgi:hypothetical protein